jgi:leader peptidase (prepilin peptidase)/N-methyltransferase
MIDPGVGTLAAAAGSATGSYIGTAALRRTRGEPSLLGRSHCDGCGRQLGLLQTVPLASFVVSRGACRDCGARIDPIHPAAEFAGAAVAVSLLTVTHLPAALVMGLLAAALLAAGVIDWRTRRLPDVLTLIVAAAGLVLAAERGGRSALVEGFVAAAITVASLLIIRAALGRMSGRQALGLGDVKLMGAMALWLGAQTPTMVASAALLALGLSAAVRPSDGRIPFGPTIGLAGWLVGLALEIGLWPR